MRSLVLGSMTALTLLSAPFTAMARAVDYSVPPEVLIAGGNELKISPLTTELHPHTRLESVTSAASADHINQSLAIYCSAYKVENPVSKLMENMKIEWNKAAMAEPDSGGFTPINLTIASASSYRRCVEISEMNVRCITKVKLVGTVTPANRQDVPIAIIGEAERDASVGGFCGNLAKGVGVVSREAVIALLRDAELKLTSPQPPASAVTPALSSATH